MRHRGNKVYIDITKIFIRHKTKVKHNTNTKSQSVTNVIPTYLLHFQLTYFFTHHFFLF